MSTKNEILNYVMETPGNTNRAVLGSLLDNLESDIEMPKITIDDEGRRLEVVRKPRVLIPAQTINISASYGNFVPGFDATGFTNKFKAICELITVGNNHYEDVLFEWNESNNYLIGYIDDNRYFRLYPNGSASILPKSGHAELNTIIEISDIITTFGSTEVKLEWDKEESSGDGESTK